MNSTPFGGTHLTYGIAVALLSGVILVLLGWLCAIVWAGEDPPDPQLSFDFDKEKDK